MEKTSLDNHEQTKNQYGESQLSDENERTLAKIFIDRVNTLQRLLFVSIPANFLCATVVFIGLLHSLGLRIMGMWYGISIIVSFVRFGLAKSYLNNPRHTKLHFEIFILATAIAAAIWGYAGSLLMPHNNVVDQMIVIVVIAGVTAGGLQSLQASFLAGAIFVTLIVLPLTIWLFLQGGSSYLILGIAMSTYLLFMLIIAKRNHTSFIETLKLQYKNWFLVESLEKVNLKLEYLSTHDNLTGLPNRASFNTLCEQALALAKRNQKKIAILFVDLDHFKDVNDKFGHSAGDELLVATTKRLQQTVRHSDIVARLGGDEFVILLEDITDKSSTEEIVKEIFHGFKQPFFISGQSILMNISIGISIYPEDGEDKNTLLKKADSALYQAKETGRNKYIFYSPQNVQAQY